jgi:hypothetical protein
MTMRTFAAIALLALSTLATAAGVENDQDLYQRQYQYAHIMMRLNGIDGEASPAELAKLKVVRTKAMTQRAVQPDARTYMLDAFADAAQQALDTRRAKRTLSRQWQINEDYPTHWSVSANPEAAADCARAIEHPLGQPLRIDMNRNGVAWLRVVAPSRGYWAFDTLISEFDTKLSVYRDCRDIAAEPKQVSDDALGLGSSVGLDAKAAGQTWLIKLERKGGVGTFAIAKGGSAGSISGRVTRATNGAPVASAYVVPIPNGAGFAYADYTNANGEFQITVYDSGLFHIRANPSYYAEPRNYLAEVHPSAVCASFQSNSTLFCDGDMTEVVGSASGNITGVDFSLDPATSVGGLVRDDITGAPIANATVEMFATDDVSEQHTGRAADTDASGRFRLDGLPPRSWRAEFSHYQFASERWDDIPCNGPAASPCTVGSGHEIATSLSEVVAVSAALTRLPHLEFQVMRGGTPSPQATVFLYSANGLYMGQGSTQYGNTPGRVNLGPLQPGIYRIVVHGTGAFSKVLGGDDCTTTCAQELWSGQLVEVPAPPGPIAVSLKPYPQLRGRVTRESDGAALGDASVTLLSPMASTSFVETNSNGEYHFDAVSPGTYFIHFRAPGHVDELNVDVPCESSNPLSSCAPADPLQVEVNSPASQIIDAALGPAARIAGTVRPLDVSSGQFGSVVMTRLTAGGVVVDSAYVTLSGSAYELTDVPAGTFVWGAGNYGYLKQLFGGVNCGGYYPDDYNGCSTGGATPVSSVLGEIRSGIDFQLQQYGTRLVLVKDAQTAAPIPGIAIDQWTLDGEWLRTSITSSAGKAQIWPNGSAGGQSLYAVRVSTDALGQYIDEVYDGVICPVGTSVYRGGCSLTGGWIVPVRDDSNTVYPPLLIDLNPADPLFKSDFE